MRVELFTTGSFVHVLKRGARGIDIVRDESDRWRFLRILFFMNDEHFDKSWTVVTRGKGLFQRPESWPKRKPLVDILSYTLMPNHIHLLLKEIQKGGVSLFMKKMGQSMTEHANLKYKEKGSLFQGAYKSKTITTNEYLQYLAIYIMVKNVFELYPKKGLAGAQENFEDAWKWATTYPFSSFGDYAGIRSNAPIVTKGILEEIFDTPHKFKSFSREVILGGKWMSVEFE
ncbi:MAG: transposase [Patescibacteria group bacterium]